MHRDPGNGPPWGAFCQITLTSCFHSFTHTFIYLGWQLEFQIACSDGIAFSPRPNVCLVCPVICPVPAQSRPQGGLGGRFHHTYAAVEASYDRGWPVFSSHFFIKATKFQPFVHDPLICMHCLYSPKVAWYVSLLYKVVIISHISYHIYLIDTTVRKHIDTS